MYDADPGFDRQHTKAIGSGPGIKGRKRIAFIQAIVKVECLNKGERHGVSIYARVHLLRN